MLAQGPGRQRRGGVGQENGFTQTPILWTPASGTAYSDALNRIITQGADPATEIAEVKAIVDAELRRDACARQRGGSTASRARRRRARPARRLSRPGELAAEAAGSTRPHRPAPHGGQWGSASLATRTTMSGSGSSSARSWLGIVVFVVAPIIWSLGLSLFEARNTVSPTEFVGLRTTGEMLSDPAFRSSLVTFVAFAAFIVPLTSLAR